MALKLTTEKLIVMKRLLDGGMAGSEVAIRVGCSARSVYEWRKTWRMGLERTTPQRKQRAEPSPRAKQCTGPPANGHKFTWDLSCGCGKTWNEQQRDPTECSGDYCDNGHLRREHWYSNPARSQSYCNTCVSERRKAKREQLAAEKAEEGMRDGS